MFSFRVLRHFRCQQWNLLEMMAGRMALNSTKKISSAHLRVLVSLPLKRTNRKIFLFPGFLILLPLILGCAGKMVEKDTQEANISYAEDEPKPEIQEQTWDGSQNLEPRLNAANILLFEDFETPGYHQKWPVHWGSAPGAGTVTLPSTYVFAGKHSAYLEAQKGRHESVGGGEYVPKTPIDEVAYVRLYLRLEDGFSMGTSSQLKLFSVRGGARVEDTYGGAGGKPTGRDKFSVTLAMDNWMKLHFYYYYPDQRGGFGDWTYCETSFFRQAGLSPAKWFCVELMLKNSTPGQKNGQLKVWLDGRLVGNVDRLRFRDVGEVKIRRFTMEGYFGGGNVSDTSPKNQRLYIDNYVVSTKPIGCFAARRLARNP
jgi:hypothetical protein